MKNNTFNLLLLATLGSFLLWGCKPQEEKQGDGAETEAVIALRQGVDKTSTCAKAFAADFAQCFSTQNQAMEEYRSCYNPLREEEKKLNSKCEVLCKNALKTNDKIAWQKCTDCQITITPSLMELHSKMQECTDSIMALISRRLICSQEISNRYATCLNE